MPGTNAHLGQAEHNLNLFAALDVEKYSDWAATVLFYTALHYVDAYLAKTISYDPDGHSARDKAIERTATLRSIRSNYRSLKDSCHNARYLPPTRYKRDELLALKDDDLAPIIAALTPHLT